MVVAIPVVVGATVVVSAALVVVGPVLGARLVVVVAMLVVVTSVVVDAAVVGGAVTVGCVVVAPVVASAVMVVVLSTVAGALAVAGPVVVVDLLTACRPGAGVVDGVGVVIGSRLAVVVVDADVGAGLVGKVGSATPGTRRGGSGCGNRVAEATRAARIVVASPKVNSSSLQGRRGLARCRGGGVGMIHGPGSAGSSDSCLSVKRTRLPCT